MAEILKKPKADHLDWRTFIEAKPDTEADIIAALDRYFSPFAALPIKTDENGKNVVDKQPCINCGKLLNGGLTSFLLGEGGGFEWGLVHGEGHCAACRWPARAYHFIKDAGGKDVMTLRNVILQYHPDFVERRT
jgi:hypothetical protein